MFSDYLGRAQKAGLELMRPHQVFKNFFIFLPLFFAFEIGNLMLLTPATLAFAAFSLAACGTYVFNDFFDRAEDRQHPVKKHRPLASGRISTSCALVLMSVLLVAGGVLMSLVSSRALALLVTYLLMNTAYTLGLKHVPIIDISVIASGFVIRLLVGSVATGVALSHWIVVMTFLLALFLALAKRRDDVLIFFRTGHKTRKVIDGYNQKFLDSAIVMTASIVILAYILWSISPEVTARLGSEYIYLTSFFVLLGVMRYLQVTYVLETSGDPASVLVRDRFMQVVLLGWFVVFAWILYLE